MGKKVAIMTHLVEQLTDLSSETRPKRCRVFDSKLLKFEFSEAKKIIKIFLVSFEWADSFPNQAKTGSYQTCNPS